MSRYTPQGKASRMLTQAESGAASGGELIFAAVGRAPRAVRMKAQRTLDALKRDGLVQNEGGFYVLTREGHDALVCLRCGQAAVFETGVPSVRLFDRRAA